MKRVTPAWLLDSGNGTIVATGLGNVLHVIEDERLIHRVPLAPLHCNRVLLWQQRVLPVTDLAALITGAPPSPARLYACVLGWRNASGETELGALLSRGLPRQVAVEDDQQAQPSAKDAQRWKNIALGFFTHFNRPVPIIDPQALFGITQGSVERDVSKVGQLSA